MRLGLVTGGVALVALSVAQTSGPARAAEAVPERMWVEAVQAGRDLRVTAHGEACPTAVIDGRPRALHLRAAADTDFPVAVCSTSLRPQDRIVTVGESRMALPSEHPHRIVILGDTGCRIKGAAVQACDDWKAWPFARVAALAAARKPDLIVHVGDYLYRESACPGGNVHCSGTPHGDTWATWDADFFAPAGPLLTAAPWVFVRGNHESCARAAKGWFRLLDAAPTPPTCPAESAPFAVDIGGLSLVAVDGADADDRDVSGDQAFRAQVVAGEALSPTPGFWLITHRPIWAIVPAKVGPIGPVDIALNRSEQVAVRGLDLGRVQLVVSGHIHEFESLDFGPGRPPQLVVGTGGDIAEKGTSPRIDRRTIEIDGKSADFMQFARFGYLVLDRDGNGWKGGFHDVWDKVVATCRIAARHLTCAPTATAG